MISGPKSDRPGVVPGIGPHLARTSVWREVAAHPIAEARARRSGAPSDAAPEPPRSPQTVQRGRQGQEYWFSRANTTVQASTMSDPPFRFRLAGFTRRSELASHRAGAAKATKREGPHAAGPGIAPQSVGLPTSRAPGPRRQWRSCCASADRYRCPGPAPREATIGGARTHQSGQATNGRWVLDCS